MDIKPAFELFNRATIFCHQHHSLSCNNTLLGVLPYLKFNN
ncbi:hypothetical protein FORC066_1337 [Yersinia enterocolitica]|nr:hypothetical protein FORC066_1337 [Yersinia enterocolitica]